MTGRAAIPSWLTMLLAAACGLVVANIYYAQPLVGPIAAAFGVAPAAAGLIVTATQIGYGSGLLFVVPLADIVENRRLVVTLVAIAAAGLLLAATAPHFAVFLAAALLIGLASVAVQVMVAFAAHLAPNGRQGHVVGNVMSGLMLGIMLARPIASAIAQLSSWHVVFFTSSAAMVAIAAVLGRLLPLRAPTSQLHYGALLASMRELALTTPPLQRRALYHAFMFAAFSLFWTVAPLLLAGPFFHLSQGGIALFALAGVAGAIVAPIGGRLADRGWVRSGTALAMIAVALAFLTTHLVEPRAVALTILVVAAIVLDAGVTLNLVLSQRVIFGLGAHHRSRLNGLFMATFFLGGAAGSAIGGWSYAHGGWTLAAWVGVALPVCALAAFATEAFPRRADGVAPEGS